MLTAVAHTLQNIGTAVYTGTGQRLSDIEQSISAYGKDIIVAAPAFPPTTYRTAAYVLHNLIDFHALCRGQGANAMQCLELYMLMGRMRYVESFIKELVEPASLSTESVSSVKPPPPDSALPLSEVDRPETVFNYAMQGVGEGMVQFVEHSILPKIRSGNDVESVESMKRALSLALCGMMRVSGRPGDPQDYNSVLVRCGLVQLSDRSAHRSTLERKLESIHDRKNQGHYYFVNREPMMQYALTQTLLSDTFLRDTSVLNTEEYIRKDLIRNDAHHNGLELLTWLLLRAMSNDKALHDLIIGGSKTDLGECMNETDFVWCDYPTQSTEDRKNRDSYWWLKKLEKEARQSYSDELQRAYSLSASDVHADDMWLHVTRLRHSDPNRAHFAWKAAVMPPQYLSPDIICCWRHETDSTREPLLVLVSCSTLPRVKHFDNDDVIAASAVGAEEYRKRVAETENGRQKVQKDSANTILHNMGQSSLEEDDPDYSGACKPLHGRRTLRILVHPNLVPDENDDVLLSKLAEAYELPKDVVKSGRGLDNAGNFVLLLNDVTLRRAIEQRRLVSSINEFPAMVLRLWKIFLDRGTELRESGN